MPDLVTDGPLIAISDDFGGVDLVTLEPTGPRAFDAPFTEKCEGCSGSGTPQRADGPEPGPCPDCVGSGRVLFAFCVDDMPRAVLVPNVIAQPWIAGRAA